LCIVLFGIGRFWLICWLIFGLTSQHDANMIPDDADMITTILTKTKANYTNKNKRTYKHINKHKNTSKYTNKNETQKAIAKCTIHKYKYEYKDKNNNTTTTTKREQIHNE